MILFTNRKINHPLFHDETKKRPARFIMERVGRLILDFELIGY